MVRRWNCGVLVLSVALFCGCSKSIADKAEYNRAAQQLAATFAATWNAKDGPAYGMAYWPDAELVDPSGRISDGRNAIIKTHEELWKATGNTQVSATIRRVRPVSPTLMVVDITVLGRGFTAPPPGGTADANGALHSNLKHLAEMRGNEWKILVSQNTFLQPQQ
jgi:uncharacterized protein (TIGR02246 family)